MKTLLLSLVILLSVSFMSCDKDYKCKIRTVTDSNHSADGKISYNLYYTPDGIQPYGSKWIKPIVDSSIVIFSGSESEMKKFEKEQTKIIKIPNYGIDRLITSKTTCHCK